MELFLFFPIWMILPIAFIMHEIYRDAEMEKERAIKLADSV